MKKKEYVNPYTDDNPEYGRLLVKQLGTISRRLLRERSASELQRFADDFSAMLIELDEIEVRMTRIKNGEGDIY